MRIGAVSVLVCVALAGVAPAGDGALRLESYAREAAAGNWQDPAPTPKPSSQLGQRLSLAREGLWSLAIPGWSQYRQGHYTRAALLFGSEVAVWSSWAVFRVQGSAREDAYQDFAAQFAGVQDTDRDEDYWKAVASYRNSEAYNQNVLIDRRSGGEAPGPLYEGADGWAWRSEERLKDFQRLRADSLGSYDRAETVLLFALITRAVAFVDAVRTAVREDEPGFSLHVEAAPLSSDPSAEFGLRRSF